MALGVAQGRGAGGALPAVTPAMRVGFTNLQEPLLSQIFGKEHLLGSCRALHFHSVGTDKYKQNSGE